MTDSTNKPEFREDDSWFSEAQLDRLAPVDYADPVHSPIPTQMVSNGEYMPIGQTDKQKEVEARLAGPPPQPAKRAGPAPRNVPATPRRPAASLLARDHVVRPGLALRPTPVLRA